MSVPQPPSNLRGHCSAIVGNTLYVLSPDSFLSLPLEEHAQWSKEKLGVPVTEPACVQVSDGADSYLYVIGGTTSDDNYGGLQAYSFASKSWKTLPVQAPVLQGRTQHSAAYLEDTQQLLIYAGSQPGAESYLSSQTFVVSTQSPHSIQAYTSTAPPGHMPLLLPWDSSHAVMMGGSTWNTQIYTFGSSEGWQPVGTNLTEPVDSAARATIINGSDGSKVLELYDMSVSPNKVSQVVLLGSGGQTASTGQTVGSPTRSRKRKRDLSLDNWPTYNDANAPTITRTDCSIAQGSDGVAVIAGGNSEAPVAIFNQNKNSWVDADKFFGSKQQPLKPTSSHKTSQSTASPTSSSTNAASSGNGESAHERMLRTLGITLGVLCGIAAIFILVLLLLRHRKMKRRKQEGYLDEKNNDDKRLSFADRGASFMKEAGGSVNHLQAPNKAWESSQNGSHSSLAIITGKFSNNRQNSFHEPKKSYDSTAPLYKSKSGTRVDNVELANLPEKRISRKPVPRTEPRPPSAPYGPMLTEGDASRDSFDSRKRSSGWSKYFATSQPTGINGLSHLPSTYGKGGVPSDASMYSNERPSQIPSSVLVAPLDIDFSKTIDGQRLSHVTSRSPAFNDSREDLALRGNLVPHQGHTGTIVNPAQRPRSHSETISSYNRSTMSTTMSVSDYYNDSSMTPWSPTGSSFKDHLNSRPPSSTYADSERRVPSRGKSAFIFSGSGSTYKPSPKSRAKLGNPASPSSDWAPLKPNNANLSAPTKPSDDRDSTVTVFPKGVPSAYYPGDRDEVRNSAKPVNTDLGWLNLGLGNGNQNRL